MNAPLRAELPYHEDSAPLFEALADRRFAAFLDSGPPRAAQGRYDVLTAEPSVTLVTRGNLTEIRSDSHAELSQEDPFVLLRRHLGEPVPPEPGLPFPGGAVGWFSYDLGRRLEKLPARAEDAERIPEMVVGIHDWALVVDHQERRSTLVGQGRDPRTREQWPELVAQLSEPVAPRYRAPFRVQGRVVSNMSREQYGERFRRVMDYIRAGDCYQVNLAQRFNVPVGGDPWLAYQALRVVSPAPYAAYLSTPFAEVLSASPERFLRVAGRQVETKPIKGTRPRAWHPREDMALYEALRESEKDRAENVMIVDLLRNDLSKTCELGTVKVPHLFEVESYATVHHLVSTVTGTLKPGCHALDLLRGCFPGGSITGAPKLRAMEIIEELEPHRRGVYCGAIGYAGFDGGMDVNIAIRTLVHSAGNARFWAGGGLVIDSREEDEYRETLDKAAGMMRLLHQASVGGVAG